MIAYGLGSVNDNITSQFQFACALALRNELNINASLEIFDPAMGKEDAGIASELGCEVIPHNEEAKRVVLRKTLFFMPHCNFSLYNGLMWSNWGEHMKNLVVVGNSFNQFSRIMTPEMNKNPTNAIYPLLPFIQETPLEMDMCKDGVTPIPDVQDAFGGLSVDMFTEEGYARAEKSGLWTRRPKEVVMGEVVDTGHNEEVDKYIEELKDNEEHEKELKEIHEEIVRTSSSDEESQAASGKESDNDSDSDSDSDSDDMLSTCTTDGERKWQMSSSRTDSRPSGLWTSRPSTRIRWERRTHVSESTYTTTKESPRPASRCACTRSVASRTLRSTSSTRSRRMTS